MLRKGATYIYLIVIFFCTQPCYAQDNETIKTFFEREKRKKYQSCLKEGEFDKIKKTEDSKDIIELDISGCKGRAIIFDFFTDGTITLLASLVNTEDFTI